MRYLSALLLLLLGPIAPAPAHASYIYTFNRTSPSGIGDIVLVVDDAAIPGGISVSEGGCGPIPGCGVYTGPSTFIALRVNGELFTPLRGRGQLNLGASVGADGSLQTIGFTLRGDYTDVNFSGTSGTYGADPGLCSLGSNPCPFTGFFTASLPEPSMLPLMGGALLALVTRRRWVR